MATYLALAAVGDYDLVRAGRDRRHRVVLAFPIEPVGRGPRASFDELDADPHLLRRHLRRPYPDDDGGAIVVPTDLGLALETQTRPLFGLDAVGDGRTSGRWPTSWPTSGSATP